MNETLSFALAGAILGKTTLIVVPTQAAAKIWRKALAGMKVPRSVRRRVTIKTALALRNGSEIAKAGAIAVTGQAGTLVVLEDTAADPGAPAGGGSLERPKEKAHGDQEKS